MAEAPKQETAKPPPSSPGRIQVVKIWLRDNEPIDLPHGHSHATQIDCTPPKNPNGQRFVAHFVPAYQVIELEHYRRPDAEPYRTRIPMSMVKRFD